MATETTKLAALPIFAIATICIIIAVFVSANALPHDKMKRTWIKILYIVGAIFLLTSIILFAASPSETTPPATPTSVTALAGNAQATVSFTSPATNFTVTVMPGNREVTGTASPIIVTGLTNGTAYTFTVKARNSIGNSAPSAATSPVTPLITNVPPATPTSVTAVAGNGQATISFTSPATNFTVTVMPGNRLVTGTASPIIVTGLTNNTAYTFTVKATNAFGTSAASAATSSVTPIDPPATPTSVTAVAGNAQATVSFTSTEHNFTVTVMPENREVTGTASPIIVTGLTNGTAYTFTVKATNSLGTSAASAATSPVTPTLNVPPATPTNVTAVAGNSQATVSFTSPATNFTVTVMPGNRLVTGTASPIIVTGLTNGTAYTFTVKATNAFGTSAASAATSPVTPNLILTYYPSIQLGVAREPNNRLHPQFNGGISIMTINTSATHSGPSGFTFITPTYNTSTMGVLGSVSNVSITNNNRTATVTNQNYYALINMNEPLTGKCMFSITTTFPGYMYDTNMIGIVSNNYNNNALINIEEGFPMGLGRDTHGIGCFDTGYVFYNMYNTIGYSDDFTKESGTNIVDIAVDVNAKLIWFRVDGRSWNNKTSLNNNPNANPATGTGGISFAVIT